MNLRKTAGLLAAAGLVVGLLGSGVGASFFDQVTGTETISVGTFDCQVTGVTGYPSSGSYDANSATYNAPPVTSSAPGSAPFSFTVKNFGSIGMALTVSGPTWGGTLDGSFSGITPTISPATLAPGATATVSAGIQWTALDNADLGDSGSATWTVACNEAAAVIFDNTPAVVPGNLPSQPFQAQQTDEWGAGVQFAGTNRKAATATVTMSSWTCQSGSGITCVTTPGATYSFPITFNVYNVGPLNAVGSLVFTTTQTFNIPFRPSADLVNCTGPDAGKWFSAGSCFNGFANNITFTFAGQTLPNNAIFGIAYNTTTWGYSPLGGSNNPSDSLNVATYPGVAGPVAPAVGGWTPNNDTAYWNTHTASNYSDAGVGGTGTFRSDTGWGGFLPAVQITATP